jgi:DNA-binding transcriptional ArsR family regulator
MSIPSEKVVIQAISHDIRREILRILKNDPRTFTELLNYFDISTGKLNYHLTQIKGFIEKDEETAKYRVILLGTKVLEILDLIKREISEADQPLLKQAYISQRNVRKPLVLQSINMCIGTICFIMVIHLLIAVVALPDPDTPFFITVILILFFIGEIISIIWLIRVRKSTPVFLEQIARHLSETE